MTELLRSKALVTHCVTATAVCCSVKFRSPGPVRKLRNAKRWEQENKVWNFSGRVILGLCASHKSGKGKVGG